MFNERALAVAAPARDAGDKDFSGAWANELGSTMTLEQDGASLQGAYWSSVSDTGGPADGEITGYASENLISFVVKWAKFEALTAWVGHFDDSSDGGQISTLWQMVKVVPDPHDEWESINAGADTFTRITR